MTRKLVHPRVAAKDRHVPRSGMRGEPKKGGGGGSFTWGKPGIEYEDDILARELNEE